MFAGTDLVGIQCPYCGEPIDLVVDCSVESQHYIEDCQVCCQPIEVSVSVDVSGDAQVDVRGQDET
ncbi:CPXCG motif-containing cysteine-rich protein [Oleiagrimonas sp. C23AA]|uniref:CPXCG motif-containing cysteine-rich protein n=1 Tax=Oleiagrimonas sp. C23AA TaxID=2719047 RepID=UPI00141F90CF|nr:CPXCG motif-containing cysteine-rich protein [Oleiagrimonas sp. C23AA]NII09734.1 CPXCG motif-containing cysteine-rich protein [Oleiagrimonas sp. C23AA]